MVNAIDAALLASLPEAGEAGVPASLARAMQYSIEKGKRIRPLLTLAAGAALGARIETLLPFACAVEFVHTYSLIHDDLPALDNDSVRRGRPTCHVLFGEAVAILAGDAMLAEAFLILLKRGRKAEAVSDQALLEIIEEIAGSASAHGLVGGQVMDLESEGRKLSESDIQKIHHRKTGSLMVTAVRVGARVAHASSEALDRLSVYGYNLGLAFQIADDVLDVVGGIERTGKLIGRDLGKEKATFASTLGIDDSQSRVESYVEQALDAISNLGQRADPLRQIARSVHHRIRFGGLGEWERF
jgi:geranylgeranyl diphosphate synthase type II